MSSGMTTRVLALILAAAAGGCAVQSTPSEPDTETQELGEPRLVGTAGDNENRRLPTTPSTLYARSGDLTPGEQESGPFPDPWHQRMGPFPDPWYSKDNGAGGNGSGTDPNHKP